MNEFVAVRLSKERIMLMDSGYKPLTLKPGVIKRTFNKKQEEIHDFFNRPYNA
ncbi:hypothetical protein [Pseudoalteromonas rubra]|uniref:hypothetical protein n=1 Tax=Pseudoalteromonas rubra TaxID=43658 RepID=UPI001486D8D2|nr:hypothetical protein [Pseudoalteromonas rubra]